MDAGLGESLEFAVCSLVFTVEPLTVLLIAYCPLPSLYMKLLKERTHFFKIIFIQREIMVAAFFAALKQFAVA